MEGDPVEPGVALEGDGAEPGLGPDGRRAEHGDAMEGRIEHGARVPAGARCPPGCGGYLQMMPVSWLSMVMVTVEPGARLVPAPGVWSITCPGSVHRAV